MTLKLRNWIGALAVAALALGGSARAEYDPIFDFIPLGGRSLLAEVLAAKPPAEEVQALLSAGRSAEQWVGYLKGRGTALPGLRQLGDEGLATLANYLSVNMPLAPEKVPADPARANWEKILPRDGRDLLLEYCQSCHIITVVVTQERPKEHWLGTMNKPSHVEIELSDREREALARYLVLNAGIPIDLIPEDLRAGGASY